MKFIKYDSNRLFFSIIIGFLIFSPITISSQNIDYEKKIISELKPYENNKNSILTDTIEEYGILKNPHFDINTIVKTKALIFKRLSDKFDPQLHVWYYYNKNTNECKGINYNWGLFNPSFSPSKNKSKLIELSKKEKVFKDKYNSLREKLIVDFGEPIKSRVISDNEYNYIENNYWEDDEKIIGLSIEFNRKLKEIPGVGIIGDFRINIMITYK